MIEAQDEIFDIIIGGGSFVGLALARALDASSQGGFRIAVIESLPLEKMRSTAFDGRTAAITAAAKQMLDVLGVWQAVAAEAQPVTAIDITDSALDTPLRTVALHFDAVLDAGEPAAFILENVRLREALMNAIGASPNIALTAPDTIVSFTASEAKVSARLQSGRSLTARLLVAADGQKSALRRMAGIKEVRWESDQTGIVATVGHEKPHQGRAIQHFLPAGPFAILPMTGNRSSLVWTETTEDAARLLALDAAGLIKEIEQRFGRHLGALALLSKPAGYPLSMNLARSFVKPRLALAGDAAHGLHWIAGQGLNHGLKDVAALTEVLIEAARLGLDIGSLAVLERYERWRRFDSASSAFAAAALNRVFSNDILALRMLRELGLGLVDRLPPLKRFFVQEAAGLTGELPRLLKGELV